MASSRPFDTSNLGLVKQVQLVYMLKDQLDLVHKQLNYLRGVCKSVDCLNRTVIELLTTVDHANDGQQAPMGYIRLLTEFIKFEQNYRVRRKKSRKLDRKLLDVNLYDQLYDLYESLFTDKCGPMGFGNSNDNNGVARTDADSCTKVQSSHDIDLDENIFIPEVHFEVQSDTAELETSDLPTINSAYLSSHTSSSLCSDLNEAVTWSGQELPASKSNLQTSRNSFITAFKSSKPKIVPKKTKTEKLNQSNITISDSDVALLDQFSSPKMKKPKTTVEADDRPFKCDKCERAFKFKVDWKRHQDMHEGKRYDCPFLDCSTSYARQKNLNQHIRIVHMKEAPLLRCDFEGCDYSSYRNDLLKSHQLVHSIERPFKCSWEGCDYSSHRIACLKNHLSVHTVERPFGCDQCDQAFKSKGSLWNHKRTHESEPRYRCSFDGCDYSTHRHQYLKDHQRVHTDERPFQCNDCDKSFRTSSCLSKHKRSCTPISSADITVNPEKLDTIGPTIGSSIFYEEEPEINST